jgi:hypothetical protein
VTALLKTAKKLDITYRLTKILNEWRLHTLRTSK